MTLRYTAADPEQGLVDETGARALHGPWLYVARALASGPLSRPSLRDALPPDLTSRRFSMTIDLMRKHRLILVEDGLIRLAPRGRAALAVSPGPAIRPPLTPGQRAD